MLKALNELTSDDFLVNKSKLSDYRLTAVQKEILKQLDPTVYTFNDYTSFAVTDLGSAEKSANYAVIPNQYFVFASDMYEFANELSKYFEIYEKVKQYARFLVGNYVQLENTINSHPEMLEIFNDKKDIELFSKFMDKDDGKYRLGSKKLIQESGIARGSIDCFSSVILKAINLPDASSGIFGRLVYDLCRNPEAYQIIKDECQSAKLEKLTFDRVVEEVNIKLNKPFILLAGISGTGKTRFVRDQAKMSGEFDKNYCLTSVRPDWHEPSDLLGYMSRLSGSAEYITTDVLQFIAKAWCAIVDSDLTIEIINVENQGEQLAVTGCSQNLNKVLPYWLCLDEMNLAPVEQYFADYLSVLETREWRWNGDNFRYISDALLKASTINLVADKGKLRKELGFEEPKYENLWKLICNYGLPIPLNLIVAGTVNMDETTHGFSRKVIDRALSFDFGEFFKNDYKDFFSPSIYSKRLSYPIWSQASRSDLANTIDTDGLRTIAFLTAVNAVLKNTPFELAFRALNELLLAIVSFQPQDERTLKAVWDDFLMCKVLPRIEGDSDKLTTADGVDILDKLNTVLADKLSPIWQADEDDKDNLRPDLHREKMVSHIAPEEQKVLYIQCRSKHKLAWMQQRLASATFTSFWP